MSFWAFAVSLVSGGFGGLGLGGGWILYAYLLSGGCEPQTARGLVLLLFLPCAAVAVAGHIKNGLVSPARLWLPAVIGAVCSLGGMWLFGLIPEAVLRWVMAAACGLLGVLELVGGIRDAAANRRGT